MKANEFVKKHGWGKVKSIVTNFNYNSSNKFIVNLNNNSAISIYDLKRLVESHDLVERAISGHNKSFKECQIDIHGLKSFVKKNPKIYPKRLKQAITDVESCM